MTTIAAKYFDGRQARSVTVEVSLDTDGTLRPTEALFEPVHADRLSVPSRIGNTPRLIGLPGGAALEIVAQDTFDRWFARHGPRRRSVHALESRLRWVIVATAAVFAIFAGSAVWGVPWASGLAARALPVTVVVQLGEGGLDMLDRALLEPSALAPARQQELQRLFADLVPPDAPDYRFGLELRGGGRIGANALALPDGTVVVTDELVALSRHDEELAAVMLHEIGHVIHRHGARRVIAHAGLAALTAALFGDVTATASLVLALPNVLLEAAYSRTMELEADDYGLERMAELGIPGERMAAMFERMAAQHAGGDGPRYVSSHPPTSERIGRFRAAQGDGGSAD